MNIKRCPFCGREIEIIYDRRDKQFVALHEFYDEADCIFSTYDIWLGDAKTIDKAIEKWNNMVDDINKTSM